MSENEMNVPDDTSELVQVNIRMAKDLKEKCVKQAAANRLSLQEWIRRALSNQIEVEEYHESNINVTLDLETTISQLIDEKFASMGIKTPIEHDLRKYNEMKDWAAAAKFADGYTTAHPLGDDEHYIVERKNNRFYLSKIRHLHSENQECIETSEISQADLDKTRTEITDNDVISFMMLPSFNGYITSGESE